MSFTKFVIYAVLLAVGLLGLLASVCGAIFAFSADSDGGVMGLALFALLGGAGTVWAVIVGWRALSSRKDP